MALPRPGAKHKAQAVSKSASPLKNKPTTAMSTVANAVATAGEHSKLRNIKKNSNSSTPTGNTLESPTKTQKLMTSANAVVVAGATGKNKNEEKKCKVDN